MRVPAKFYASPKLLSLGGSERRLDGRCAVAATAARALPLGLSGVPEHPRASQRTSSAPTPPACPPVVGELETASGGFTAAVNQLCNVATLPGVWMRTPLPPALLLPLLWGCCRVAAQRAEAGCQATSVHPLPYPA